jgi:ABC-2 type transport system permease protein
MYLVFFGYGFQSFASSGGSGGSYLSFLAPGIMSFQSVMAGTVGGSMLWADRRWGMLSQLLVGPFTRSEYLFGIMLTSLLFGLGGATVMLVLAAVLLGSTVASGTGVLAIFGAIAIGSIFFGSLMLLISAKVKSNNAYNSIQVLLIFFVNFASTVFYPSSPSLPFALRALFGGNPLTYVADTARAGYLGTLGITNVYEMLGLVAATAAVLGLAIRAYLRSDVSID